MAVLGIGGRFVLKRKAPDPCIIFTDRLLGRDPLLIDDASNQILDICNGYITGDRVHAVGLPIDVEGIPIKPNGWAMYQGSAWYVGPNRQHIENESDQFYRDTEEYPLGQAGDSGRFYASAGDEVEPGLPVPEDPENEYFIHVNGVGYVSFYTSRCDALKGCPENRINLWKVGLPMVLGPYGSATYNNAIAECLPEWGDYRYSQVQEGAYQICYDVPTFELPEAGKGDYENADVIPRGSATKGYIWEVMCGIREWTLNLSAPEVDTTAVSEKFGEAVKSLVSGGGSLEFFIDKTCHPEGINNPLLLMELLLMTDKNSQATAEFWMLTDNNKCDDPCKPAGSLFYEADILVTQNSVNLRPTDLVAGVANFVTTGEIRLLQEPYERPLVER